MGRPMALNFFLRGSSRVRFGKSRAVLEAVVDTLGPPAIGPLAGAKGKCSVQQIDPLVALRERAITKLSKRLTREGVRKANGILDVGEGPSREWSQAAVARLIDLALDQHMRANGGLFLRPS